MRESVKKFQNFLKHVAVNSVGRSMPLAVYERKIPDEVLSSINKLSDRKKILSTNKPKEKKYY